MDLDLSTHKKSFNRVSRLDEKSTVVKLENKLAGFAVFVMVLCALFLALGTPNANASTSERSIKLSSLVSPHAAKNTVYQNNRSQPSIFGASETKSTDIRPFKKWTSVLRRYQRQMMTSEAATYKAWFARMEYLRDKPVMERIRQVNNIVNLNRYVNDQQGYGQSDHWATPVEFITKRYGDCEDFAIAKLMALKALGLSESSMRIAVVQDKQKNVPHAVLVVSHNGQSYLLDNQIKQVVNTSQVAHYAPFYSISRTAWWRHIEPQKTAMLR